MPTEQQTGLLPYLRRVAGSTSAGDVELLRRFLAHRDEAAFAALVRRHGPLVFGVCQRVLRNRQDAEDAFQATFLVLACKAGTVGAPERLANWLYGVAYRTALHARGRRVRREIKERQAVTAVRPPAEPAWADVREVLDDEVHLLPPRYREPFVLCYLQGKSSDEAAALLGCARGTVFSRLAWARERLRGRLARRGLALSAAAIATLLAENVAAAAMPAGVASATARAALGFSKTSLAGSGVSAEVAALAQGVLRTMQWTRIKLIAALFVTAAVFVVSVFALQAREGESYGAAAAVAPQQEKQPKGKGKSDAERFVGTWKITTIQANGEILPPELKVLARLVFAKDGKAAMKLADEGDEGSFKLPAAGQIDLAINKGGPVPGIYKFDGDDSLTLCLPINERGNRPMEFDGTRGSGQLLFVLQRAKPGEEKPTAEEVAKYQGDIDKIKEAAARKASQNNLKQMGIAFHQYLDANQRFPAHAIYSKDGKKALLSWRVAILPYIGEGELYKQFKLDEPWDSDHNKKLIAKMPKIYEPVGMGKKDEGKTYYQVFTGKDTAFDGPTGFRITDITDGTSNTILAIEGKDSVTWTQPADLALPQKKDRLTPIGGLFKNGTNALFFDGSVRFLARSIDGEQLRALVTPAAGD
jgi:RNA polymerase sigma factor (sigma-70 family)